VGTIKTNYWRGYSTHYVVRVSFIDILGSARCARSRGTVLFVVRLTSSAANNTIRSVRTTYSVVCKHDNSGNSSSGSGSSSSSGGNRVMCTEIITGILLLIAVSYARLDLVVFAVRSVLCCHLVLAENKKEQKNNDLISVDRRCTRNVTRSKTRRFVLRASRVFRVRPTFRFVASLCGEKEKTHADLGP
jgi:hypothetical protein